MLVFYALEDRNPWFILAFAGACALGSVYGFLQGAWPLGVVETIWAGVAVWRWREEGFYGLRKIAVVQAHLTIGKMPNDIYKIEFDTVQGKLVGQVSVRLGGLDARSDEDKKQAALGKFKALARALDEAIVEL